MSDAVVTSAGLVDLGPLHLPVEAPHFVSALLNGLQGCAAVIDPAGRYLYANREYLSFAQTSAANMVGNTVASVLGDAVHDAYQAAMTQLVPDTPLHREGWTDYGRLGRCYVQQTIPPIDWGMALWQAMWRCRVI